MATIATSRTAGWACRSCSISATGHLLPAPVDHVLDPPGDPDVAALVDPGQVAGAVPAVGRDRLGGQLGTVQVALEQAVGVHLEVALLAWGERPAGVVDDAQGHAVQGAAVGAPGTLGRIAGARTRSPGSSRWCPRPRPPRRPAPRGPCAPVRGGSRRRWPRTCAAARVARRARRPPGSGRPGTAWPPARTSRRTGASRRARSRRPTPPGAPGARRGAARSTSRRGSRSGGPAARARRPRRSGPSPKCAMW